MISTIAESSSTSTEMQFMRGILPILIATRGLIDPPLYQVSPSDLEIADLPPPSPGGYTPSVPPAGGTYGGGFGSHPGEGREDGES